MLQYITNEKSATPVAEQIRKVVAAGCRWVEIDMPDSSDEEIGKVVKDIKDLCEKTETFLLLHNKVELAKEVNVGGVRLDDDSMTPSKARLLLGPAAVIGVGVSSIEDVERVKALDIDFLSIQLFEDRINKSASLGIKGIKEICDKMKAEKVEMAAVAYGGIKFEDIDALLNVGVNGIAVSDAIAFSDDIEEETKKFLRD